MQSNRREWLYGCLAAAVWADVCAAQQHAHEAATARVPTKLEVLDPASAAAVEALTAQIIPSGDSPGAREAGVVWFIDRSLGTFDSDKRELYRQGLEMARAKRLVLFPASSSAETLTSAQQVELLHAIENTEFFEILRVHTVLGFLGHPKYGGNRNQVGWKHIGFDDRMIWEAPFGYYDAEARRSR